MLENLFYAQFPECFYFIIFIIYSKEIKEKRGLLSILMIINYFAITSIFFNDIYFHLFFIINNYLILKILYKEKTQIIDVFWLNAGILLCLIFTLIFMLFNLFFENACLLCLLSKIILILFIIIFKKQISNIYKKYYLHWNIDYKNERKIKSLTLRHWSIFGINIALLFSFFFLR